MTYPIPTTPAESLFRCWNSGRSIAETRGLMKRRHGDDPGFEAVRQGFVRLCERVATKFDAEAA